MKYDESRGQCNTSVFPVISVPFANLKLRFRLMDDEYGKMLRFNMRIFVFVIKSGFFLPFTVNITVKSLIE